MTGEPGEVKRARLWPGIVVMVVGVTCSVIGVVMLLGGRLDELVHLNVVRTPAVVHMACSDGDYYVYQHVGPVSGEGGLTTLVPSEVHVVGPGGGQVATWAGGSSETIGLSQGAFVGAVGFHVSGAGRCAVRIDAVSPAEVVVGPTLASVFAASLGAIGVMGLGGLIALGGIVLLIISVVRRNSPGTGVRQDLPPYPPPYQAAEPVYPAYPLPAADEAGPGVRAGSG